MVNAIDRQKALEMNKKLRTEGFLVDVNFRKAGHHITISPKLLGVDVDGNEDLKGFFSDFMSNNKVSFLRKSVTKKAESISKAAHKEKRARALGETGNLMTRAILDDFKDYLDGKKEAYFKARDEIVDQYDELVDEFKMDFQNKLVNTTMSSLSAAEREEITEKVFARIPSKEDYRDSFKVGMSRTKISLAEEVDSSEVDDVLQDTLDQVNEITGKNLSIAFSALNNLMEQYNLNGLLNNRNRSVFTSVPADLKKRNLFNDALVDEIIVTMTRFKSKDTSDSQIVEDCEVMVSKIYGYAEEINVLDQLDIANAALTADEMMELYELFNMEVEEAEEAEYMF